MTKSKKIIIILSIIAFVGLILVWVEKSAANKQEIETQFMDEEGIRNVSALNRAISMYFEQKSNPELCRRNEDGDRPSYSSNTGTDKMDGTGWLPLDFSSFSIEDRDSIMSSLPMGRDDRSYYVPCDGGEPFPRDGYIGISTGILSKKYASLEGVIEGFFNAMPPGFGSSIYYQEATVKYTPTPADEVINLSDQ